ncbi:Golgi-associated plant pathogenesis-related protein 1-like [Dermacentor albipictus]|uniref:Golgi-associated plant pathogenesis-related protein 1-like n=1 Tax=Dermacentor albipictus TaxID=60249 RepID=UPI0031FCC5E3
MKLVAVLAIAIFSASVPASGFRMIQRFNMRPPGKGGMGGMGGMGGGGPFEPTDFEGDFTQSMRKLQRQVLRSHNRYRRLHGVHTLKEDEELNRYAQAWALMLAQRDRMEHRTKPIHGENLFMSWSSNLEAPITGSMAVKAWYDEIKDYDYNNPTFKSGTGHFTQVVWKNCRRLGTGIARGRKGTIYIVSVYDPRGNIMGQFGSQVTRPNAGGGGGGKGGHKKRRRQQQQDDY